MTAPAFVTSLSQFGDRVALVDDRGTQLRYAELAAQVESLAATLPEKRSLVMVEVASQIPSVVAYLAALKAGHAVIVAKPGDVASAGSIYQQFRPSVVHEAGKDGFRGLHDEDPEIHPDVAALYSTSGSTGSAKLVRLSAPNIQTNAESIATYLDIDESEITPTVLPLSYSYGASILSSHLLRGARLILTEYSVVDPEFVTLFEREKCTSLSGVPYTWELIEQVGLLDRDWPHLATLTQAGGKMPASRVLRLATWAKENHKRLFVMYGQTECTARMSYLPWEHTLEHSDCIGVAIPGGEFRLVDEDGESVEGTGQRGELVYSGPNVMMGYATTREELANPPGPQERPTGDLAERNEIGLYRIVGRISRFSKIMGLRISLDEIESMIANAGIEGASVAGNDDIVAIGLLAGDQDAGALETQIATDCGIPKDVVVVVDCGSNIPRLHNGKVDYQSLIAQAKEIAELRQSEVVGLREELAGLLGLPNLGDEDTFSGVGGDSLTYIQTSLSIEGRLGHLPEDWEHLPVRTLEAYESGADPGAGAGIDTGKTNRAVAIDVDVLLRAIAITFVVFNHSRPNGAPIAPGAMAALLMTAGLNLARFRADSLFQGEGFALIKSTFTRYMLPYLAILVAYLVAKQSFDLPSLLLVSSFFDPRAGTFLEPYWFIEVFFQITILLGVWFSVPFLRDKTEDYPLVLGAAAVAILGAMQLAANANAIELPPLLAWTGVFALGWCVHFADSRNEKIALSVAALALPWLVPRGMNSAVVLWLLISLPRVPLGSIVVKEFIGRIGAASFQIYIFHTIVVTALGMIPDMRGSTLYPILSVPISVALGLYLNALPSWQVALARLREVRG